VAPEPELVAELPLWKDPSLIALAKEVAQYLVFAIIAFLVWSKLLKPMFEMLAAAAHRVEAEENAAAELAEETIEGHHAHKGPTFEDQLKEARDVAHKEPKLIAELIREWMGAGGA
jgi:flagellar M-ring protein FliF